MRLFRPTELLKAQRQSSGAARRWKDGKLHKKVGGKWVVVGEGSTRLGKKKIVSKKVVKKPASKGSRDFWEKARGPMKYLSVVPDLNKQEWAKRPSEMMGETYAKATAMFAQEKLGKYLDDPKTKAFIQGAFDAGTDSWHSLAQYGDKEIKLIARAAKDISKGIPANDILQYIGARTDILETSMLRILEQGAYLDDPKYAIDSVMAEYKFYGLAAEEAKVRAIAYLNSGKPEEVSAAKKVWGKK